MTKIEETRTVSREVVVGRECDFCGRKESDADIIDAEWLYFNEGHSGWGNDSVDSMIWYDVCSAACFLQLLPNCIKSVDGYRDAEVAEMPVNFCKQLLELVK